MSSDQAREIAERIARRVNTRAPEARGQADINLSSELAAVRATLNELQNRLVQIVRVVRLRRVAPRSAFSRRGLETSTIRARTALVLKRPRFRSSSISFKMKRLAAWNRAASLAITARCAVREGSSFYFVGFCRNEFELMVGGCVAPSSALK
jgi:hypothetical protein